MNDEYWEKGRVNASIAWGAVVALLTAGWVIAILLPQHWRWAGMFAASGCAFSAFAAVLHIRCYAVRVANLVRARGGAASEFQGPRALSDL